MLVTGITPNPLSQEETRLRLVESTAREKSADASPQKNIHKKVKELSDADHTVLSKLKAVDTRVKQHEQAHLSAAAGLNVTPANFTYQRGPNGVNYAVAGEVKIDTSPGRNAADTLAKAEQIIDAALAPADPSPADRSVAAKAAYMAQQARAELQQQSSAQKPHGIDTFA